MAVAAVALLAEAVAEDLDVAFLDGQAVFLVVVVWRQQGEVLVGGLELTPPPEDEGDCTWQAGRVNGAVAEEVGGR